MFDENACRHPIIYWLAQFGLLIGFIVLCIMQGAANEGKHDNDVTMVTLSDGMNYDVRFVVTMM